MQRGRYVRRNRIEIARLAYEIAQFDDQRMGMHRTSVDKLLRRTARGRSDRPATPLLSPGDKSIAGPLLLLGNDTERIINLACIVR